LNKKFKLKLGKNYRTTDIIFLKPIPIFSIFLPIFDQLPIFDWPPIPTFQNLLTYIFADILIKYFVKVGANCLPTRLTAV